MRPGILVEGGPADPEALGNGRHRNSRILQQRPRRRLVGFAELAPPATLAAAGSAAFRPSMVRSRLRSRKDSAIVPRKANISRPVGVSVSTFSVSDSTLTPCCCRSWAVLTISRKRAAQPVHLPHHELVLGTQGGEGGLERRTPGPDAPILEDFLAAGRTKRIALQVQALVVCRDAGITNQHVRIVRRYRLLYNRIPAYLPDRNRRRGGVFNVPRCECQENGPDCVETLGMTWLRYVRWGPFLTGTATLVPMHHIEGLDRDQAQLLPARVDDYVEADNPVRFIDAFVEGLDLQEAGFARVQPKPTGRPGYDPADLLKLYIYGYVNRVRSSRRLEAETRRNLEVIWLLRHLQPDFKTIADFRKDNRHAFKAVFRQVVLLCRKLDLFGRELIAVDGTRLKAVNSTDRNFTREKLTKLIQSADERLADYLARLDRTDAEEDTATNRRAKNLADKLAALQQRRAWQVELLQELERTGESQISLTDPDSRAMASYPKVGVGYNAQVAVDAKHKLIVEQHVTNAGSDLGLLAPTAGAAKEVLGVERIEAVADKILCRRSGP